MFRSVWSPHGSSSLWNPQLLWLNIASDSLIAVAYLLISVLLVRIVRGRRDIPFDRLFFCFAAFILACSATRVMLVVTLWHPMYWELGMLKAVTAIISLVALGLLWRSVPAILAIPIANRRAESVLENTNVGIFAVDRNWVFRYVNEDAKKLLKDRDLLGEDMWESFPGMTAETTERLQQVMATRTPAGFDSYYPPLDLSTHLSVNPWEDGGITVCFSDISEQKRMQRELDLERVMREQRLEVLARFSAGIAHEIKNPMAIIHARASDLAELAAEGEVERTKIEKACESIVKTSDRAMQILRGLAALARQGPNEPMQEASPGAMVEQAIELVRGRYRAHGIHLESTVPDGLTPVECREVQIGQVLLNLLNNAFDAIDASPDSQRWVRVEACEGGPERLQIDVVDGGPALSTEVREHLMEPFYTTKPLGGGIGMGLSVSRAIATDHGGTLELRDCNGHTCFRLTLPVHAVQVEGVAA